MELYLKLILISLVFPTLLFVLGVMNRYEQLKECNKDGRKWILAEMLQASFIIFVGIFVILLTIVTFSAMI